MCDVCVDFLSLLVAYETRVSCTEHKHTRLSKHEVDIVFGYIQTWPQRQCMCCYRDIKNFERFNLVVQSMICLAVYQLKNAEILVENHNNRIAGVSVATGNNNNNDAAGSGSGSGCGSGGSSVDNDPPPPMDTTEKKDENETKTVETDNENVDNSAVTKTEETWTLSEVEKLLILVAKAFLLNFPLYIAYKHAVHSRLDDISPQDAQSLSIFCDLHENEMPVYLLRNVTLFCNTHGFAHMTLCFDIRNLPLSTAHAITAVVSNLKLWLNYRTMVTLFVPIRVKILQYMCKLADQDLRSPATKSMADFMWTAIKDPLDTQVNFDTDGLALAFKYFTSTTLTMRLAGMAQINAHINLFNDICTSETVAEVEIVGQKLADWLIENKIISHLFGPNLHVEVVKQSPVVLRFLAVENQITEEHLNLIWQAAQLKHCSKAVYDVLPSLVKNLTLPPALYMYSLLCRLHPRDHTDQSIFIASSIIKLIWSRDGPRQSMDMPGSSAILDPNVGSSSENSVSIDGSNSDEEHPDDESSDGHKSTIDIEGGSDSGPTPCKQAKHKNCCEETTDDSSKIEEIADDIEAEDIKLEESLPRVNRHLVATIKDSSSEEGIDDSETYNVRKKLRKRRKARLIASKVQQRPNIETISDADSDEVAGMNDSDCSESQLPSAMLGHMHGEGAFLNTMSDGNLLNLLSGGENDNDGSYSSPMSQKSGKNMGDFDDDDSPCEEELAQLAAMRTGSMPEFDTPRSININEHFRGNNSNIATKHNKQTIAVKHVESTNKACGLHATTLGLADISQPGNILLWDLLMDDKIGFLNESLASETEKTLRGLLCFNADRSVRTKFVENCLQNLATNRSVIVSLKILPNLLASFQQFRAVDTHQVTLWAERHHKMMHHFFSNLKFYANTMRNAHQYQPVANENGDPVYSHTTEVQVRLEFLTSIFSSMGSPDTFRLSLEQVDMLWGWLANDAECADCLFAWLQSQAKGSDQHALGIDTLQHLYLKKLPELRPEGITMIGLGLFQQLCSLARIAAHFENKSESSPLDFVGMSHLWKIALRAANTDVSLAAIQYINSYYMGQQLKLEKEFVAHCMNHLKQAAEDLDHVEFQEKSLMCVQRALMLLNTHLETFRRRYAFHLRRWTLEGQGFSSHSALRNDTIGPAIRIILQPGGLPDKSILHLHTTDLIADLKAEISKWWETLQGGAKSSGATAPVLGLLLSEGPLRIITQGQEITSDYDERSLADVGFKDNQMVYVSLGGRSGRRREPSDHPSLQPPPPKECLPTVLLLQPKYFEELFKLMQKLGDMYVPGKCGIMQSHTKAQLLSRRVWDILAMLPTNPELLERFKSLDTHNGLDEDTENINVSYVENKSETEPLTENQIREQIGELLDPHNLQKFMYSLHIVESLSKIKYPGCTTGLETNSKTSPNKAKGNVTPRGSPLKQRQLEPNTPTKSTPEKSDDSNENEIKKSVIENSDGQNELGKGSDQKPIENQVGPASPATAECSNIRQTHQWTDSFIKCGGMRHLYDIFMSGVLQTDNKCENEWRTDCLASLLRILCLLGVKELRPEDTILTVPEINDHMVHLMTPKPTLRRLASILTDAGKPTNPHQFKTGYWGRAQVIHFAMNILVCLVHSSAQAREYLWTEPEICGWLQRFILDDPDPAVRREACAALYRICLGNSVAYDTLMGPVLSRLVSFLPVAEKMISQMANPMTTEDGKDPYGPACRDYFWLLCRLVDTLTTEIVKESLEEPEKAVIDIEGLCRQVSESIMKRKFNETRFNSQDDGLVGLLNLMANLIKYDPPFKFSTDAETFISKIFDCLFDLPTSQNRHKPKCKSQSSRAAAYDLLVELCRNAPKNFIILHGKLMKQHIPGPHSPYPWDYWPRDDGRSEAGYVGLTNLGATCYMASCIQHMFMMPQARESILQIEPQKALKHVTTLQELQRMFAYLMESERKSYNPRSFCRVYQMDHQPLNTGEQKDMAEFFIDFVSKLEEMSPDLKVIIKQLFCGTLSNNVVSLDCGHVSKTREEFYTVRCQVAHMRDLHESLAEVTVKDTLEGDNMYTCDQCGRKVRAEKRACFRKLPQILCFNTMRYTFNMLTMQKEKVNTHFSFPMRLDMSSFVEKTLMPQQYLDDKKERLKQAAEAAAAAAAIAAVATAEAEILHNSNDENINNNPIEDKLELSSIIDNTLSIKDDENDDDFVEHYEYRLIGVTVHTGTADGGHYYSFIKERSNPNSNQQEDRWFLFNDAEVKQFDPSQIEAECFGGEMTSKTYDSVTEKYLDFSFEKTNSAYMLFYERCYDNKDDEQQANCSTETKPTASAGEAYEQMPSCSTATIGNKPSSPIKQMVAETTALDTNVDLDENVNSMILASGATKPPSHTNEQQETESNSDLVIGPNICDIDNKGDANSNVTGNITTNTPDEKSRAVVTFKSTTPANVLSKELEEWIWEDNRYFLQDRNIFEHTYFNFMWQICGHIPQSLLMQTDVTCMAAQLSVSFFIETFIHAKEKPTMVLWVELLTKQFNANQEACEWFLSHMSTEFWWPVHILIKCPNQMVRQMFQRLVIHVIQRLRPSHNNLYLKTETDADGKEIVGEASCVTKFIKSLITIMEHGAKAHLRHLSEFFGLLYDFSRMGEEETLFLLKINVIRSVADFYLGHKPQNECIDTGSDNDDNSSDEAVSIDKARPASLDKMIALVASLVERSRGADLRLQLSPRDYNAIAGGKGFPFLYQQIKDNINPHQTRHLIHALCRWDDRLANQIITMLFTSVTRHTELCGPFFKLLTLLTESSGGPSGLPCFSQLVLQRVWDAAEYCPQSALDWLAVQAPRNKIAHTWILQSAESWVEQFLLAHNNAKVRNAAAYLLVSLVPSQSFRANYRAASLKLPIHAPQRELSGEAQIILHTILNLLLRLLRPARAYTDILVHGPNKLSAYFSLMTYCMVTKAEKLMLNPYLRALWELFHPRLSEPSVPAHHNKQALLAFWHHATNDCPENAQYVANCPDITRNIAFNYILADHDDSDIVAYNRAMLPAYYGLLRLCCQQSRALTRQLAAHQNLQWAFKNITPHPTQYALAVDELFCLMSLFASRHPDDTEVEQREISTFRRTTLSAYLNGLEARVSWGTLIAAFRTLIDNDEDRLFVVFNGGITMCFEALSTLHSMYHEATACHVSGDLQELLTELLLLVKSLRFNAREQKKRPPAAALKGLPEAVRRLATLLNTHNPPQMRILALDVLTELVRNPNLEIINILTTLLSTCHMQNSSNSGPIGPYFPRRGSKQQYPAVNKNNPRPPRSMGQMVQMSIPQTHIIQRGSDKDFDAALDFFYKPYHDFLDVMLRTAINTNIFNEALVNLSCLTGIEGANLHFNLFPKFWIGIFNNKNTHKYTEMLLANANLIDYVYTVLRDDRISLIDPCIYGFFDLYIPRITLQHADRLIDSICQSVTSKENYEELCGDLMALRLLSQSKNGLPISQFKQLKACVKILSARFKDEFIDEDDETTPPPPKKQRCTPNTSDISNESPTLTEKLSEKGTSNKSKEENESDGKSESSIQNTSSDPAPSIETDSVEASTATQTTDDKPVDIEMAEPKPSTSQSIANLSPAQTDAVESTSTGSVDNSPKNSSRAEKDYERRLLKKIQLNLQCIWRAIETSDSETSSNANTSGTSTSSATSQPISSTVKPNEESAEAMVPNEHETTSQEQTHTSEHQT